MSINGDGTSDAANTLHLIGFRVDPHFPEPDFYVLTTGIDGDVPLLYEGQIILFQRPDGAQEALKRAFQDRATQRRPPTDLALVVDLAQVFYLLTNESRDESAFLLNAINALLDFLKAAKVVVPPTYKADLYEMADHLTFNKSFGELFGDDATLDREQAVEAIQWAFGAVMSKSMFVPKAAHSSAVKHAELPSRRA